MYISQLNCKTQGLRKAYINSMTNDRHYNIKSLKKLDKDLARTYTNTKYYGGSLKSFWQKAKRFGKRILDSAVTTTKNMYKPVKWIIKNIANNDTVKGIVSAAADALGASVGIPGLGKMVTTAITAANNISDKIEVIFDKIVEKNPNATKDELKKLFDMTKEEIVNISNQTNITSEQKKKIEDTLKDITPKDIINKVGVKVGEKIKDKVHKNKIKDLGDVIELDKIEAIMKKNPTVTKKEAETLVKQIEGPVKEIGQNENSTEEIVEALPELIKSEGLEKVNASAGYLPYLNLSTVSSKERVGKGGKVLSPTIRVNKPQLISRNSEIFKKYGIPTWAPAKVGPVAGSLKTILNKECGRVYLSGEKKEKESGRVFMGGESEERKSIIARLKARSGK